MTYRAAIVVGTMAILVVVATFLPIGPFPAGVAIGLFLLVFPIFGLTVIRESKAMPRDKSVRRTSTRRSSGPTPSQILRRAPRRSRVALATLWGALWLAGMSSFLGASGQPTQEDGRYLLNSHGEFTEVSRSEYDRASNLGTRGFASVASAFCVAAAALSKYGGPVPDDPSGSSDAG